MSIEDMEKYSLTGNQFDYLVGRKNNSRVSTKTLQFRHCGEHPTHSSLLESESFARSVDYALEYGCPVMMNIENGVVLSFSIAEMATTHSIDNESDVYIIKHCGDAEDGIFYVPKNNPDCEHILELLRYSLEQQQPFCFESAFNVVDTADGPFGQLEYTSIIFPGGK